MTDRPAIVVGIDGGYASGAALELALLEADLRDTSVLAVTCWSPTPTDRDEALPCTSAAQASELLEIVVQTAWRRHLSSVHVVRAAVEAAAGPGLVDASREAELLVLGAPAGGMVGAPHAGRTIGHCLGSAGSPVVVVPWTFDAFGTRTGPGTPPP